MVNWLCMDVGKYAASYSYRALSRKKTPLVTYSVSFYITRQNLTSLAATLKIVLYEVSLQRSVRWQKHCNGKRFWYYVMPACMSFLFLPICYFSHSNSKYWGWAEIFCLGFPFIRCLYTCLLIILSLYEF